MITSNQVWDHNSEYWSKKIQEKKDETRELFGLPAFIDYLGEVSGKKILDAGCGEGSITRQLKNQGANIEGFDISEAMLRIARDQEKGSENPLKYVQGPAEEISHYFESDTYDLIYSYMMLCCNNNLDAFFKGCHNLLKISGEIVFAVPHPCFNTSSSLWIKEEGAINGLLVKDYFKVEPYIREWDFMTQLDKKENNKKMQEVRYPWLLSDYLNSLILAGFKIESILEPQPSVQAIEQQARLQRWRKHAGCFMFVRGKKYEI